MKNSIIQTSKNNIILIMIIVTLFSPIFILSQSPKTQTQPTQQEENKNNKDKRQILNRGLIGLGNSTTGDTNVNPQTNVRSLRYKFYTGKDTVNHLTLVIRHSISNFSFELNNETSVQKVAIESIGSEILNTKGGIASFAVGKKKHQIFPNRNEQLLKWEISTKFITYNRSTFISSEEDKLSLLPFISGIYEWDYSWGLKNDSGNHSNRTQNKSKYEEENFIGLNALAGFSFSPIFNSDNIYFDIFQDDRGNPAKVLGFLGSVGLELKIDKIILSIGAIGRFPDADIFGLQPRWYFSVSNP